MLKKLLVLGAIVAVMPMDREKQLELYDMARATMADMSGFCSRNPDVCRKGSKVAGEVAGELATKAEAGARMMVELAREQAMHTASADRLPHFATATAGATSSTRAKTPASTTKPTAAPGQKKSQFYGYDPSPAGSRERLPTIEETETGGTLSSADLEPSWGLQ